ncbi:helix-turn-helix domain-containing protein [Candidatus Uhrbacteria bacterium]|nr:helix-turn-helix domain-containing protein [Candidatus Uhrbacteria bacterium]
MTQAEALAILKSGANVFLTGEPGSGKTHTINQYVAQMRSCGIEPAITASTGIAATHIGGYTIHSWSGIGIRRDLTKYDIDRIGQNRNVVRRITNAQILIIDEVSMLSARVLSMIDAVCREIRRNQQPFGGLQTILVGDFFQLPPVSKREEDEEAQESFSQEPPREKFAFFSPAWDTLNPLVCYLSEQHRQEDTIFLEFLSAVRRATVAESHRHLLRTRYSAKPKNGITQLYSHNVGVNEINDAELAKLAGDVKTFEMTSRGPEKLIASLKRGCLSPELLSLKIGAWVMFTKNDITTHRYVNGTLGIVTGFSGTGFPIVKTNIGRTIFAEPDEWHIEDGGRVLARIMQIPLRLAWAMTVHKSQGMSLDAAHMDLSDTFEYGQGYVALSRVRTLAGLSLAGLNARALEVHPEILAKDAGFREQSRKSREAFSSMPKQELETLHSNFIRACGGKLGIGPKQKVARVPTLEATFALLKSRKSIHEIAQTRGLVETTISSHIFDLYSKGRIGRADIEPLASPILKKSLPKIHAAFKELGLERLTPVFEKLGGAYSYDDLRLARMLYQVPK